MENDENKTTEDVKDTNEPLPTEENNLSNMPSAPASPVVDSITKRLQNEDVEAKVDPSAPTSNEPKNIDLTALTPEQLTVLKQMLAGAPDRVMKQKGNPIVTLREVGGKIVIDFKNSYLALKTDTVERRDKEVHFIPVKFLGEDKFTDVELFVFHNAPRINCEVVKHSSEKKEFIEGKTISRDTGTEVEMFRYEVVDIFTIKLPSGELIDINSKVVNG